MKTTIDMVKNNMKYAGIYCSRCGKKLENRVEKNFGICDECTQKGRTAIKKMFTGQFKTGWKEFKEVYFK